MELAAHWHRYQNLPKNECILLSAVYRWRDDPVKKGLAKGCVSFFCSECRWVSLTPTRGVTPFSLAQADFPSHFTKLPDLQAYADELFQFQADFPSHFTKQNMALFKIAMVVSIPSGLPKP